MKTLECSSKGDKRFCSFYAFVDFDGKYKNIEAHLQDCKRNEDGKPCQKRRMGNAYRAVRSKTAYIQLYRILSVLMVYVLPHKPRPCGLRFGV